MLELSANELNRVYGGFPEIKELKAHHLLIKLSNGDSFKFGTPNQTRDHLDYIELFVSNDGIGNCIDNAGKYQINVDYCGEHVFFSVTW